VICTANADGQRLEGRGSLTGPVRESIKSWMDGAASVCWGAELSDRAVYLSAAGHVTDRPDA
jgi:hypothetical protein